MKLQGLILVNLCSSISSILVYLVYLVYLVLFGYTSFISV